MGVYRMYTNIDIVKRRVLHGNVTFVWLWWSDWVTVLSAKLMRKLMIRSRGGSQGTFFSMTRCQNIRTLISTFFHALVLCFLTPNHKSRSSCDARFVRPHSQLSHSLSLIQLPLVLWRSHLHAEREDHS